MILSALEVCAGGGGQALGLEAAGFTHVCLVDIDSAPCETLRRNRPSWRVAQQDVRTFTARHLEGVDLLAAGVPCPPFSIAGRQLGAQDERDLFPEIIRLARECRPRVLMIENVAGLLTERFAAYRAQVGIAFEEHGYRLEWRLLDAADFGVPQQRRRAVLVGLRRDVRNSMVWPTPSTQRTTVGAALRDLMSAGGWEGAAEWSARANQVAPTIVGGSKRHGGADLGPTRARQKWQGLGIDGRSLANSPPPRGFCGMPRLTLKMAARLQGFPDSWLFAGRKTSVYRQLGNAFPPPVAKAIADRLVALLMP